MPELEIDFLESYDEAAIVVELQRVAAITGRSTVTKRDLEAYGRVSYETVNRRFGSLRRALEAAGLVPQRYMNATDDELLAILVDLWAKTLEAEGRAPQRKDLRVYGVPVSGDTFLRRFGSWRKALVAAASTVRPDADVSGASDPIRTPEPAPSRQRREAMSDRKRFFVFKRDSYTCKICHASGVPIEVDHVIPVAKGGTDDLDNLQTLCFSCNRGKRDSLQ